MIYISKINLFHNQTNINQYKLKQIYVITDHMDKLLQCIQISCSTVSGIWNSSPSNEGMILPVIYQMIFVFNIYFEILY